MLQKRIDNGSIAYGTAIAGENIVKGSLVRLVTVAGVEKAMLCTVLTQADAVGFAYTPVATDLGTIKDNDIIKIGKRLIIYTLNTGNVWATTQFTPDVGLIAGAFCSIADDGKIKLKIGAEISRFVVFQLQNAGEAYNDAMLNVRVL